MAETQRDLEAEREALIQESEDILSPEMLEAVELAEAFDNQQRPKVQFVVSAIGTVDADYQ